ncbi:carbohydrate binding domain-containing protein [bacterium]|nr:carbohydrate binding domain-containing protein [bacterium]
MRKSGIICLSLLLAAAYVPVADAQDRRLVWADEFNGSALDRSVWSFQLGQFNDCVHYATDRAENTEVSGGTLKLIAREESYRGYSYTASVIKTIHTAWWQYGRIEARIKLPSSSGFVPAFWLQPEDEAYGWWPASGEIDIMEHPTNEVSTIYGTIHNGAYNSFFGSGPRGGTIDIPTAESAFHLYAVEWTPQGIDFYVDDTKYYTFTNENSGYETWPFDQPFYIILNMAVGGGWVGSPTETTVFPAVMEVDYVRVYQYLSDIHICGPDYVLPAQEGLSYTAPALGTMQYQWSVPNTADIVSGQGSPEISVDWGNFSSTLDLYYVDGGASGHLRYPVRMSNNLLKNGDFETGTKYWNINGFSPARADFALSAADVFSGDRSVSVDVSVPGANPWDVQLSQTGVSLSAGTTYQVSLWAKSGTNSTANVNVIDASLFTPWGGRSLQLTDIWTEYAFSFSVPANAQGMLTVDMGQAGTYQFDAFRISGPDVPFANQVTNGDFSDGDAGWELTAHYPAAGTGGADEGEYRAAISNGGINPWDIHVGQTGFTIEKGKEYTLSFDAWAAAPRQISPLVGMNSDPWTVYSGGNPVLISMQRQTYRLTFIMEQATDMAARCGFDIGGSSDDVSIDNVYLSQGGWPAPVDESISAGPRSLRLHQNWPNPFNAATTISFDLARPQVARLAVYTAGGRLLETLLYGELAAGTHHLQWGGGGRPSGVYLCVLSAGGRRQVRKMLLIR